ncbi:MAG: AEC family transporter [Anaerolineae bacterium]
MFLSIFNAVLLPLVIIASLAFMLARFSGVSPKPLSRAAFYLFNPSLAFVSFASTALAPALLGRLMLLKLLVFLVMLPLAGLTARKLKLSGTVGSAFVLSVMLANSGNYGLSVTEYAFGKEGLALAVICYVTDNMLANSAGIYIAARGRASIGQALRQMLQNPALYTVALGIATHQLGWQVPLPIWRAAESLSGAAVPTMLTVLGMQLAGLPSVRNHWQAVGVASALRLIVAPAVAALLVIPLGLSGLARQVAILETAVPTAVVTSIIASQYESEPAFVASTVLASSLASLVTVTALLTWIT